MPPEKERLDAALDAEPNQQSTNVTSPHHHEETGFSHSSRSRQRDVLAHDIPVIDAEVVDPINTADAKRLDKRIRLLVQTIADKWTKLYELVDQAKRGLIHEALGYPSWTAYVADVFSVQVRLDRDQRRELVGYLSGEGMSQRVIAEVVGVDQKTVSNDLRAGEENSSSHRILR